jgi:uncharacterized protein (DUF362 family)
MGRVSIIKAEPDLLTSVVRAIYQAGEKPVIRGDRVLIKPNLVIPADPDSGEITSPTLVEAVARYCLDCGASEVIIGEGPGYYQPASRLRDCFTRTGIASVAERLGIRWVLFDEHRYRTFRGVSDFTPDEFRVTEFAFNCDKFINLPVLKTHWLTTVTLAMKNLKGCLKREDKPRFHDCDLDRAVVELNKIVRPTINIIDCTARKIVRQRVRDYSEWKQAGGGVLITGSDIVAVDAVGCALMGIDPAEVRTVSLGKAAGLGESDLTRIDVAGEELRRLKFRIELPQAELRQNFPLLEIRGAEKACSGCLIPLLSALTLLREQGTNLGHPLAVCLGKKPQIPEDMPWLLLGDCALTEGVDMSRYLPGCPPGREDIVDWLAQAMAG